MNEEKPNLKPIKRVKKGEPFHLRFNKTIDAYLRNEVFASEETAPNVYFEHLVVRDMERKGV